MPGASDAPCRVVGHEQYRGSHGRWHYQENIHFCRISRGSIQELIDDFNTCEDENYGQLPLRVELKRDAFALIARVNGYIAYLRKSQQGDDPA